MSKRYSLLFWALGLCTLITVIVTIVMVVRLMRRQPALTAPAPAAPAGPPAAASASAPDLTEEPFADGGGVTSIVYVYSDGCPWCDRFNPVWADFEARYTGAALVTKHEAATEDAARYNVPGYPTVLAVRSGKVVDTFSGERTVENLLSFAQAH